MTASLAGSPGDFRLAERPPENAQAFTDAVSSAEGLDPSTADRHLYRQVREMVLAAFRENVIGREGDA
jgi:hypothetical protein